MGDETLTLQPHRTADVAAPDSLVGVQAGGRYRIERFIGKGGMGEIYAAQDLVLGTTIALKTLRSDRAQSSETIERLRREITLARNVTNAHVCRLHDVGDHDGRVFLTMELLEGTTLAELIATTGALPIADVDRFAAQLVDGMSALHRAGIIHRDFKSSNVIVVGDGDSARAVITDFGLARSVEAGDARLTVESSLLGTPAYMAPEQVEARPATKASDVYAFGVVMFELLTGELPFKGDTPMTTAMARLERDAPRPSAIRAGGERVPPRWDAIVRRCLARDPASRPLRIDDVLAIRPRSRRWFLAAGGGVLAAGALGAWRFGGCADAPVVLGPVAVLPVGDDEQYVQDPWRIAITLDLYAELGTTDLELMSPYAAGQFVWLDEPAAKLAGDPDPLATLAIRDVRTAIRVTMSRTTDRIELTLAGLGDVIGGWEHVVSRPLAETPQLVSDAAFAIANELGARPPRRPRDSGLFTAASYERYGRGLSWCFKQHTEAETAGIEANRLPGPRRLLRELANESPKLGRVSVRMAEIDVMDAEQAQQAKAADVLAQVNVYVTAALAVDPDDALAIAVRGHAAMLEWNWRAADVDTRRAVELAPGNTRVRYHHQFLLMALGRFDEALVYVDSRRILRPDGRPPRLKSWHYYYARRWQELIRLVEPTLEKSFDPFDGLLLAMAYAEVARYTDANALADRVRGTKPDNYFLSALVPVYAMSGRDEDAKQIRAQIGDATDLEALAIMDDAFGDTDAALDKLERVVASHNIHALFLRIERFSPRLRSSPRFQKLLKTVFGDYP